MTAHNLLHQLHGLGVILKPYPNGMLRYKAPKGTMTPELLDAIRQHKTVLHDLVEAFEEKAAISEYCSGLPRPAAEARAWACVLEEKAHDGCAACGYQHVAGATP